MSYVTQHLRYDMSISTVVLENEYTANEKLRRIIQQNDKEVARIYIRKHTRPPLRFRSFHDLEPFQDFMEYGDDEVKCSRGFRLNDVYKLVPVVLNAIHGGFQLNDEIRAVVGDDFDDKKRTDPTLIKAVRSESTHVAKLFGLSVCRYYLRGIPADVFLSEKWVIVDYGGMEIIKLL